MLIIQVLLILGLPLLFLWTAKKIKFLSAIGPIILCYGAGILLANIPGLPWDRGLSMTFSEITVPLAIPLILFSTDIVRWLKMAKKTVISFVLVLVSAMIASLAAALIFAGSLPEGWKVSGMLTGCYTGGTPNLMSLGMSLGVASETIVLVNASDMLLGGVYFLLLVTVVKVVVRKILPPFDKSQIIDENEEMESLNPIFSHGAKKGIKNILFAGGMALVAVGLAVGIAILITGKMAVAPIILVVTTIGVGLSFIPKIRNITGTWRMGQYVILVFSLAIGGTVDVAGFFSAAPIYIGYVATVMFMALFIHLILAYIFKIDADTALITSTAGIYGPAFIGPVSEALGNRHVVVSGLVSGLMGYAVGNYLGTLVAYAAKWMLGL